MPTPALLDDLESRLQALRDGADAAAWSQATRAQPALWADLPPQFETVLLNLLDRLESGALFNQESCSFSQEALVDSLQQWVDAARRILRSTAA
ncbi:MAG: hypothetical protein ACK40S_03255 [Burkholderiaceae bacterium]|jgi:hypothetical protein